MLKWYIPDFSPCILPSATMEAKQEENKIKGEERWGKRGNQAISFPPFSQGKHTYAFKGTQTQYTHSGDGRMVGDTYMRTLCRTWLGQELWWRERRRRRRKERREKGGERDRGEVDEQAATQRGSSKQHNVASRPSLPPRQPDALAPLSAAAFKDPRSTHKRSASPAAKDRRPFGQLFQ